MAKAVDRIRVCGHELHFATHRSGKSHGDHHGDHCRRHAFSCVGILTFDSYLFRENLGRDLSALARIVANNSTASLAFDDPKTATETLNALRARDHIVAACLYQVDGTVLARYTHPGATQGCPPEDRNDELRFGSSEPTVSYSILVGTRRIGTLMMLYDLAEITQRRQFYGTMVIGVLLVSGLMAFLLSSNLRASFRRPYRGW